MGDAATLIEAADIALLGRQARRQEPHAQHGLGRRRRRRARPSGQPLRPRRELGSVGLTGGRRMAPLATFGALMVSVVACLVLGLVLLASAVLKLVDPAGDACCAGDLRRARRGTRARALGVR